MQVSSLVQDLIKQLVGELNLLSAKDIKLGELFTANVKAVNGDNVLIRFQNKDIHAKTLIPLEAGETITIQFQGMQQGKAVFKLLSEQSNDQEKNFLANILTSMQLPKTDNNQEIIKQMIRNQLPLNKADVQQISNSIKTLATPAEDIGKAVLLFKQGLPVTSDNIDYINDFNNEKFNIFKGLDAIKNFLAEKPPIPENLKTALDNLVSTGEQSRITLQDSEDQISAKLAAAFKWLSNEEPEPMIATSTATSTNIETTGLTRKIDPQESSVEASQPENANIPLLTPTENKDVKNPSLLSPENEVTKTTTPPSKQNITEEPAQLDKTVGPDITNGRIPVKTEKEALLKENIFIQLQHLAASSLKENTKINSFLEKVRELLENNGQEIKTTINTALKELDNPKSVQENTLREVIKEISGKLNFIENLIPTNQEDKSQQVVFYSQAILKNGDANETPINLTVKKPKDKAGQKIDFNNCTLMVTLNTNNLGLIKAIVQKAERTLSCELTVASSEIAKRLESAIPELAGNLEKLNYLVNIKPVKITSNNNAALTIPPEETKNLFNIDIRI